MTTAPEKPPAVMPWGPFVEVAKGVFVRRSKIVRIRASGLSVNIVVGDDVVGVTGFESEREALRWARELAGLDDE